MTNPNTIPAYVHAIGGATGSASALLLLFPLERARIELQALATRDDGGSEEQDDSLALTEREEASKVEGDSDPYLVLPSNADGKKKKYSTSAFKPPSLLQCIQTLWERNELYRGVAPQVMSLALAQFIFFYLHAAAKQVLLTEKHHRTSKQRLLLASCLAGMGNVLLTNPAWVLSTRRVSGETQKSILEELWELWQAGDICSLWRGTGASLLLVSNPVIHFFAYEQLKQAHLKVNADSSSLGSTSQLQLQLSPVRAFLTGALAKALATLLTYPLQLAQTTLRLQNRQQSDIASAKRYKGVVDALQHIYRNHGGFSGCYRGLRAKLWQSVLTAAVTFLTYEQILRAVVNVHQDLVIQRKRVKPKTSSIRI